MYFKRFPKIEFLNQQITDLTIGLKLHKLINDGSYDLLNYEVREGEQPDHVAYNYYEDPKLTWLVLLPNNIIDPYFQWPLSTKDFNEFIKKKYGSIATAQATTIHCEHKTKNITVSPDSLTVSNGVSSSDYDAIDAYTYWDRINDNRRFIKLIHKVNLKDTLEQFKQLV